MRRREVIALLTAAAAPSMACVAASPAKAQARAKPARIGYMQWGRQTAETRDRIRHFREELLELGYVEGRDVEIVMRFAEGSNARAAEIAADFARGGFDVIVAGATPSVHAAKAATQDVPIVMSNVADPIATGLVASLSRPGGNITGVTMLGPDVAPKRLELLREATPRLRRLAFLGARHDPNTETFLRQIAPAADAVGLSFVPILVEGPSDFERAFATFVEQGAEAVMVQPLFIIDHAPTIADLAIRHRLSSISDESRYAKAGGLMSYGVDWTTLSRRAAHFVDKILKGARPGDLPVEQPTRFDLVINLGTAKALGLTIPPTLLARADEVIE